MYYFAIHHDLYWFKSSVPEVKVYAPNLVLYQWDTETYRQAHRWGGTDVIWRYTHEDPTWNNMEHPYGCFNLHRNWIIYAIFELTYHHRIYRKQCDLRRFLLATISIRRTCSLKNHRIEAKLHPLIRGFLWFIVKPVEVALWFTHQKCYTVMDMGYGHFPGTVTTRIITCLVGNPYKP